jgi:hypothetical protein
MTHIGIIGSGNIGSNVARAAIAVGHTVTISNSRGPESLADLIAELGPNASAATTQETATSGELVLVAIPLGRIGEIDAAPLEGKIVMDANNYYPGRDGRIEALDRNESTTSELLQAHLPGSRVVKTFNNIYAAQIPTDGTPPGTLGRRALPIAGHDADAKRAVTEFLDSLGFDAVDMGPLSESWRSERDTLAYSPRSNAEELRELLATTARIQQV